MGAQRNTLEFTLLDDIGAKPQSSRVCATGRCFEIPNVLKLPSGAQSLHVNRGIQFFVCRRDAAPCLEFC